MPLTFYDPSHAQLRLGNTIIRLKGLPIFVGEIRGDYSTVIQYLGSGKQSEVDDIRKLEDIDLTPVPLGFVQIGERAYYMMRKPSRRTKQGLSEESLFIHEFGGRSSIRQDAAYRKAVSNTILGEYPSLKASFKMLGNQFSSVPIHRNWALRSSSSGLKKLLYKYSGVVGHWDDVLGKMVLSTDFEYLREVLDQELGL